MADRILLSGAQFFGHHGVTAEEQRVGNRYVVDVELTYGLERAGVSDDLHDTISYSDVYRSVREIVEGSSYHLVEALARAIAQALLNRFPAEEVHVRVKKQPPPTAGIVEYAGVEIVRQRT